MYKIKDNSIFHDSIHLSWPLHKNNLKHLSGQHKVPLIPLFIPFAGCIERCIFCAQHIQSGQKSPHIDAVLKQAESHIAQHRAPHLPELAFFGGTFTALPQKTRTQCCEFVRHYTDKQHIHSARCSTRPDALSHNILRELWQAGFRTVELGIQSFHDDALHQAQRHYTGDIARKACHLIKEHGFTLGIQLMPGMPGVATQTFLDDVRTALTCNASFMRFYPCQVIKETQLAALWHKGSFTPWDFDSTVKALRDAWLLTEAAGVPVIRMGLAPEPGLEAHILAGPRHPCLGSIVHSEALYSYIYNNIQSHTTAQGRIIRHAHLPRACQGFFWGHKKHLAARWQALGIHAADKKNAVRTNITWHQGNDIILQTDIFF